jgi:peptidoglycan/LPS O-acetylase OafA/YrhL
LLGLDEPAWGSPEYASFLHIYLLPHLAFYVNIASAIHGYVASLSLGPLWTISLEEQFYFLWPLFLALAGFDKKKILFAGVGLLVLTVTARFFFIQWGFPHPAIWVSLPTRLDPFVLGTLLALFEKELLQWTRKTPAWLFMVTGMACVIGAMALPEMEKQEPSVIYQFGLLDMGWILILFSVFKPGWPQKLATWSPFPRWGKISYGLYVYHYMALHFMGMAAHWFQGEARLYLSSWAVGWSVTAAGFLLTLGLSRLSYDFYEKPFLKLKERFTFVRSRTA